MYVSRYMVQGRDDHERGNCSAVQARFGLPRYIKCLR